MAVSIGSRSMTSTDVSVPLDQLGECCISLRGLLFVQFDVRIIIAAPSQMRVVVCVEMVEVFRQPRRVMSSYEPSSCLCLHCHQMRDASIDVVPRQTFSSPLLQRGLIVRIELSEIMEDRSILDGIAQTSLQSVLGAEVQHRICALQGTASDRADMLAIRLQHAVRLAGRVSEVWHSKLSCLRFGPSLSAQILEAGKALAKVGRELGRHVVVCDATRRRIRVIAFALRPQSIKQQRIRA